MSLNQNTHLLGSLLKIKIALSHFRAVVPKFLLTVYTSHTSQCNHLKFLFPGAPCLSFDVLRDAEGEGREMFPLSMLLCAGTQADTALSNRSVHFTDQQIKTVCTLYFIFQTPGHGWH